MHLSPRCGDPDLSGGLVRSVRVAGLGRLLSGEASTGALYKRQERKAAAGKCVARVRLTPYGHDQPANAPFNAQRPASVMRICVTSMLSPPVASLRRYTHESVADMRRRRLA